MKQINAIEKEFVPYELELKLKHLGCDKFINYTTYDPYPTENKGILYQQAFDWFRTEHKLFSTILISGADDFQVYIHDLNTRNKKHFSRHKPRSCDWVIRFIYDNRNTIYEEARLACLNKLIELVEREYEED